MVQEPKSSKYIICRPNGEWEQYTVPRFFSPRDVANAAHYSDVWLFLPKGYRVFGDCTDHEYKGPCWVYIHPTHGPWAAVRNIPSAFNFYIVSRLMREGTTYIVDDDPSLTAKRKDG